MTPAETTPRAKRWWRRPWVGPLAVLVVAFLAYSLPPYLAMDPARSRVPAPEGFAAHYWFLVAHVLFGTVAIVGVLLQIWPWFRRKHPVGHRRVGRIYVFAGAIPSALMAGTIGAMSPFGPATSTLDVIAASLWFGFTVAGWKAARERRFGEHRKWMIRSFAMAMNTLLTRFYGPFVFMAIGSGKDTRFGGNDQWFTDVSSATSAALSLFTLLVVSQWWLERRPARRPVLAR
ncbi:DUF2306 domain-containing protein [Amycolatopsis sp. NPDC058986]|uniref:DUF2306 domain-containing protein n=1 Tax=unclassified Amycolatopsis TaxID=2618356 RepID=UPI003670C7CC